jgi:hypothetical protein
MFQNYEVAYGEKGDNCKEEIPLQSIASVGMSKTFLRVKIHTAFLYQETT